MHAPDVPIVEGLQVASIPAGIPLSAKAIVPVNPFKVPTFAVNVVLLPAVTVCELGDADNAKSGGLFSITPTVVL